MNRKIKFRAWDGRDMLDCGYVPVGMLNKYEVPVMQFTGLLDKNEVEIYEGDIVQASWNGEEPLAVEFRKGGFCFGFYDNTLGVQEEVYKEKFEVIGNIYENSDLLK